MGKALDEAMAAVRRDFEAEMAARERVALAVDTVYVGPGVRRVTVARVGVDPRVVAPVEVGLVYEVEDDAEADTRLWVAGNLGYEEIKGAALDLARRHAEARYGNGRYVVTMRSDLIEVPA